MKIINGKELAAKIRASVKEKVEKIVQGGYAAPVLACILVEGDPASEVYVRNKVKACEECAIGSRLVRLKNDVSKAQLFDELKKLNKDEKVSGILLQLPLPEHLPADEALEMIDSQKDVDCLTTTNLGRLFKGCGQIAPCTATGVMEILKNEKIETEGKRAVVVGRSLLVGKSVAQLLEKANATVTICHSKTKNLEEVTRQADILVVAIGKPNFIKAQHVKDGAVVIDVGINRTESGLKGDVDFDAVKDKCSYITPVPGGVGPLTVACLMQNTLVLHKAKLKI